MSLKNILKVKIDLKNNKKSDNIKQTKALSLSLIENVCIRLEMFVSDWNCLYRIKNVC